MGAHFQRNGDAEHIARPTEIDDLGLGCQGVGNHRHATLGGLQARGTPVDVGDPALHAIDGDVVIELIGLGGVQDDPGKHVTEGTLQGQPDDDRQRTGRRQHALDRQIEHIGQGGYDRDQENHRTEQILKQSPGVPDPLHHHRADQHGQGPRAEQPPADLQTGGRQMQGYVVSPGRRLHRVQAFVEQQQAEQRKNHHPYQ
ncbi:hypothetical protein D9M69_536980 [compost metagenome]